MLEIIDLKKGFGGKQVIDGMNLTIPEGSVFGFLGANGSGKTTTMKMIMGFLRSDSGKILHQGKELTFGSPRRGIGYLPDVPSFYGYLTPRQYLKYLQELLGGKQEGKRIDELLELVGLQEADRKIKGFSRGMKQRLGIAQALLGEPALLLCDEPTSALDPMGRKDMLDILKKISGDTTIVFSTHILVDVERICDSYGILKNGKIERSGRMEDLSKTAGSNRILLELFEDAQGFSERIKDLPGVEQVLIKGNSLVVVTQHREQAGRELIGALAQSGCPVKRYEIAEPTLEDIFVEVNK